MKLSFLRVDGGASANNFLMQFQSDLLDAQVVRPSCIETTALGAAYMAGLAAGFWKDAEGIRQNWKQEREFSPSVEPEKREALSERMAESSTLHLPVGEGRIDIFVWIQIYESGKDGRFK